MTTIGPPPPQEKASPNRVTVVDFDMPFGSMIAFMLKWALAAIPAMVILILIGSVVFTIGAGLMAGLASSGRVATSTGPDTTLALTVTIRPTASGWQVTSDGDVAWRNCSLSVGMLRE